MGEMYLNTENRSGQAFIEVHGRQSQLALEAYGSEQLDAPPAGERVVIMQSRTQRHPDIYVPDKGVTPIYHGLQTVIEKLNDNHIEGEQFYIALACQLRFNPVMIGLFQQTTRRMIEKSIHDTQRGFLKIVSEDGGERLPHSANLLDKQVNHYRNNQHTRELGQAT